MRLHCVTVFAFLVLAGSAGAAPLEIGAVNEAQLQFPLRENERISPILIKAQILLDRAHFTPGEIDGKFGDNLKKALLAFAATQGLNSKGELTDEIWQKLTSTNSDPVLKNTRSQTMILNITTMPVGPNPKAGAECRAHRDDDRRCRRHTTLRPRQEEQRRRP